ncbi:hypothetical protein KAURM247S_05861 [Kitasatospora aureofaciens]
MTGKPSCPVRREAARKRTCHGQAPRRAADPTSWMNNFGKLRRRTERRKAAVQFFLAPACTVVTVRCLIRRAWTHRRWNARPRSPRIR